MALKKLNLLIPLSKKSSRGDQILNAKFFKENGFSEMILEEDLSQDLFLCTLKNLVEKKDFYLKNMAMASFTNGTKKIIEQIKKYV